MVGHVSSWSKSGSQMDLPPVEGDLNRCDTKTNVNSLTPSASAASISVSTATVKNAATIFVASKPVAVVRAKICEKFEQLFYYHGLNCSRHPILLILSALLIFVVCIYPLVGLHFFHNDYSQQFTTPLNDFLALRQLNRQLHIHFENQYISVNNTFEDGIQNNKHRLNSKNFSSFHEYLINHHSFDLRKELKNPPRWFLFRNPCAYVMQILVKSSVNPWKDNLILMDAIRAPLAQVFQLVESVSNFQYQSMDTNQFFSLNDLCLQVAEPTMLTKKESFAYLPRYSCLMLSPANIWNNDLNKFLQDSEIIKTIFSITDTSSLEAGSFKELLFGLPWMQTGIRQMYVRTRQRTITFAITLVFKEFNEEYIEALTSYLYNKYPRNPIKPANDLPDSENIFNIFFKQDIVHLYFQNNVRFVEYFPIICCYFLLCIYVYYSMRKLDIIGRKWLLAGATLITVILSLFMAVGICFWLQFNPTSNGSDILPYFVMIIGLENVIILTKSVSSTPRHLDMKIRLAQGLSKESSSILINLGVTLCILASAFFTFIPIIQDMCAFGIVAFISDFIMQMFLFAPLLAINLVRPVQSKKHKRQPSNGKPLSCTFKNETSTNSDASSLNRVNPSNVGLTKVFARPSPPLNFKLPKRLRFLYFWASKRIAHKCILMGFIGWMLVLLCKTAIFDSFASRDKLFIMNQTFNGLTLQSGRGRKMMQEIKKNTQLSSDFYRNKHNKFSFSNSLSSQHWSTLFWNYNISLKGEYISILPSIHLSIPVEPEQAIKTRNPSESDPQIFRQYLFTGSQASSLADLPDDFYDEDYMTYEQNKHKSFYNYFTKSLFLTTGISIFILILIVSLLTSLYKCVCSRKYAEWRTSWTGFNDKNQMIKGEHFESLVTEAMPWKFKAHVEEIEFICTNGNDPIVASCDFQGDVRVWDILSGESYTFINRSPKHCRFDQTNVANGNLDAQDAQTNNATKLECDSMATPDLKNQTVDNQNGFNFTPYFERLNNSKSVLSQLISKIKKTRPNFSEYQDLPLSNSIINSNLLPQSIWCVKFHEKFVILGCANGRIEVWHAIFGELCFHSTTSSSGITAINASGSKLFAARLDGTVDIFEQELKSDEQCDDSSSDFERISTINASSNSHLHFRNSLGKQNEVCHANKLNQSVISSSPASQTSLNTPAYLQKTNHITFRHLQTINAHKQPISCIKISSMHLITASADHLLKIYRIDGLLCACVYNLHGHLGPITCLELDQQSNYALSGCQLGQICVWDFISGTCVFSMEAHQAPISSLLATSLYIVSASLDQKINIWDKYTGHLITTIYEKPSLCQQICMLANNILVTAKEDELHLWEVSEGKLLKIIKLTSDCKFAYIRNLSLCFRGKVLVCDHGTNLCFIHFLGTLQKQE